MILVPKGVRVRVPSITLIMWTPAARGQFNRCKIAEAMHGDAFSGHGYVAVLDGKFAGITSFACESGMDLWLDIQRQENGEVDWDWVGTPEELFAAAKDETDLMFPTRKINPLDADYTIMSDLYKGIRKWFKKHKKL